MDKRMILAVAGSGKTTYLLNMLNLEERFLLITYTQNNTRNLKEGIINLFGYFPNNIRLVPYFSFLYSFCFRPLLSNSIKAQGINYGRNPNRYAKKTDLDYYVDSYGRLFANRLSAFFEASNISEDINFRLEKYFDRLFIDEVQDFAGHDFNFLKNIVKSNVDMVFVGDFYQHTFDTSSDGNVNSKLHGDYQNYKNKLREIGVTIDTETLVNSYRCNSTVCNFIKEHLGIEIYTNRNLESNICIINTIEQADEVYKDNNIVKLFYQESHKYECYSQNWGNCKGEDKYYDVCVVLNKGTQQKFLLNKLHELAPQTKNKLYVACSRTKNNLYLVSDEFYRQYKM